MTQKKINVIKTFLVLLLACTISVSQAQGPGGPGPDPDPDPADGSSVPFDGGISLLVAAGIGYAAKKRYDAVKKEKKAGDII